MDGTLFDLDHHQHQPGKEFAGDSLIIDSFAGGGGASTGIEMALGRAPDVAINHDPVALAMHEANHPDTLHMTASVYSVDPRDLVKPGQRVGLLWASPDCTHHSKAKGGQPLRKEIRDLAWVIVHYAELVAPEIIMLENVEEFRDWGPLCAKGRPISDEKGAEFDKWVRALRRLGYVVEWRVLRACDYGAPTIRKRLFLIARRDGRPIVWPKPTHRPPHHVAAIHGAVPRYRTAADIIDWSLPCPSIFDTKEQIKERYGLRSQRPLADNTLRRIARGVQKYIVDAQKPFIVLCNHAGHGFRGQDVDDPLMTITAARDAVGLVAPTLVQVGYGERAGQAPRALDIGKPLGTVVAQGTKQALVASTLVAYYGPGDGGQNRAQRPSAPLTTVTTENRHALVSAFLAQHNGGPRNEGATGRAADAPLSTITVRGTQQAIIAANMVNLRGTADDQLKGASITSPVGTVSAGGGHAGLVAAFLQKYYGTDQDPQLADPLHTITTKDRFGLVTVQIDGQRYVITDIGMRMLTPREQFSAQGFPTDYIIDRGADGRAITKSNQTHKCGNSVPPPVVAALVAANCGHLKGGAA